MYYKNREYTELSNIHHTTFIWKFQWTHQDRFLSRRQYFILQNFEDVELRYSFSHKSFPLAICPSDLLQWCWDGLLDSYLFLIESGLHPKRQIVITSYCKIKTGSSAKFSQIKWPPRVLGGEKRRTLTTKQNQVHTALFSTLLFIICTLNQPLLLYSYTKTTITFPLLSLAWGDPLHDRDPSTERYWSNCHELAFFMHFHLVGRVHSDIAGLTIVILIFASCISGQSPHCNRDYQLQLHYWFLTHTHTHTHTNIYIHVYTHSHMHTYTHTHKLTFPRNFETTQTKIWPPSQLHTKPHHTSTHTSLSFSLSHTHKHTHTHTMYTHTQERLLATSWALFLHHDAAKLLLVPCQCTLQNTQVQKQEHQRQQNSKLTETHMILM